MHSLRKKSYRSGVCPLRAEGTELKEEEKEREKNEN